MVTVLNAIVPNRVVATLEVILRITTLSVVHAAVELLAVVRITHEAIAGAGR